MTPRVWGVAQDDRRVGLGFDCPGCGLTHVVYLEGRVTWTWNGSMDRPTFNPSLLVTCEWGEERTQIRCHSFIRDGRIEFLADSTHPLAGHTIDLPEVDRG